MASYLYPSFKEGLLNKEFNLDTDTIKVALVTGSYNSANTVVGDVTRVGTDQNITTGSAITGGVFSSTTNPTWTAVAAGSTVVALVLWDDTHATDKLIAYIDITDFVTNDGDVTITWDTGANKIFAL